ncbi:MAG: class I SAM-dependent methyltransferase [Geminicoccaceae bacterium]
MADAGVPWDGRAYDRTRRADPRIAAKLTLYLRSQASGRCLDLACGTGNYTISLAASGLTMVGVDASTAMLDAARAKAPQQAWHRATAAALPYSDGSFDGAICTLAIHHFAGLDAAFAEIHRVLRKGRFVVFTAWPEQARAYWLNAYFPRAMARSIEQMPARAVVLSALERAGLAVVAIDPWEVPPDLSDLFLYCGKHRPELYLDPVVRAGISTFTGLADAEEVAAGLARLRHDIGSGRITEVMAAFPRGGGDYVFVAAEKRGAP